MVLGNDNEPATKGDVKKVADDVKKVAGEVAKVAGEVAKVAGEVAKVAGNLKNVALEVVNIKGEMRDKLQAMATKDDVSRILAAIDAFAGKAVTYDQKAISHGAILTDHEDKLRDHGRRLTAIETKP